jgi:dTDP-glucose 4,6-dehydratase
MILTALEERPLPVYGDGSNVRDWLYVDDHCEAILDVLERGRTGETYVIGGGGERANIEIVRAICEILDSARPRARGRYDELITFVRDRPGHDFRYAMDYSLARKELDFSPSCTFEQGLVETLDWYRANPFWISDVTSGAYRTFLETWYGGRL